MEKGYFGGLSVNIHQNLNSSLLEEKIIKYTRKIEKYILQAEAPKKFRKVIPIREGIQFRFNEEITNESEPFLFRVTAV